MTRITARPRHRRVALPFAVQCKAAGLPVPVAEFKFHPTRRWRFDFCWPGEVGLEVQGAIFTQGRHVRGAALIKEYEKLNAAAVLGYRVLFVTPQQVANGEALSIVEAVLVSLGVEAAELH